MVLSVLKKIFRIPIKLKYVVPQIPAMMAFIKDSSSYYPEEEHRSKRTIFWENLWWLVKYSEINRYYFSYGFDRKNIKDRENYIAWPEFKKTLLKMADLSSTDVYHTSYYCLLRDKFIFGKLLTGLGFSSPRIFAMFESGQLVWSDSPSIGNLDDLCKMPDLDVFFKDLHGEGARKVFSVKLNAGILYIDGKASTIEDLRPLINGKFIAQERIKQHPALDQIYPHSTNTIRLVTVRENNKARAFSAALSCGAYGILVDNVDVGGMAGRLDIVTGKVDPIWLRKPKYGGRTRIHPDTGFVFDGFEVPYFKEAVQQATKLHDSISWFHSIGWDIAITPQGPCFLEGNDNWGIMAQQMLWGGLKRQYLQTLPHNLK